MNSTPTGLRARTIAVAVAALVTLSAAACGDDDGTATAADGDEATTVANCDTEVVLDTAPLAAVTMNQAATEVMLTLGLEEHMAGTAYMDDEILPELADAYESVPVLSEEYPSQEALLDEEPDFVYASYASAFGEEAAGDRDQLADLGIGSYLSPAGCPEFRESGDQLTFDVVMQEITDVATLFGVPDEGETVVAEQVLITDGRASGGSAEVDDALSVADGIRRRDITATVIDTETGRHRLSLATDLADRLGADLTRPDPRS